MAISVFHSDHGVSQAHVDYAVSQVNRPGVDNGDSELNGFFLFTWMLPASLSDLQSALHGPCCGDAPVPSSECEMVKRGERPNLSRLCNRANRPSRLMTAVGTRDRETGDIVFYTLYGGKAAPREPLDEAFADESLHAEWLESVSFWATHALSRS